MPSSQSADIPANQRHASTCYTNPSTAPVPSLLTASKVAYGKLLMSSLFFSTGMLLMFFLVHLG